MSKPIKVLNLYAGLGGNRKKWKNVEVTAIEYTQKIADVYSKQYPGDKVIVGDAKEYLLNHFQEFDFIWGSPPCQSHTRMIKSGKNRKPRYTDLSLYELIMFLRNYFEGKWIIENVKPYYEPLIKPTATIGRHLVWSNFIISSIKYPVFS